MRIVVSMAEHAGLIELRVEGKLTLAEFVRSIDAVYGDPRFDPASDILVEIAPGASSGLTPLEVSGILQALRSRGPLRGTGRTALMASDAADLGMVQLLSHVLQGGPRVMRVFGSRQQALQWLAAGHDRRHG